MVREATPVDISTMPDLVRLADEVARTRTPRVLERDGEAVAVLSPAPVKRRRKGKTVTQEAIEAALSVFGAWKGHIDAEQFKRDIKAAR
jgi:urease gamma subunit